MTNAASHDAPASARQHLLAAQFYLADDPQFAPLVRTLNDVRAELEQVPARPVLRLIQGGADAD